MFNFKSQYTKLLESLLEEKKIEIARLQERNDELTKALVPVLRRMEAQNTPQATAAEIVKVKSPHQMQQSGNSAKCSCGWIAAGGDPAELQAEIDKHYREMSINLRSSRKSWPITRARLEEQAAVEEMKA
jgi:hypothetical protein